jgi:hypothetical protein
MKISAETDRRPWRVRFGDEPGYLKDILWIDTDKLTFAQCCGFWDIGPADVIGVQGGVATPPAFIRQAVAMHVDEAALLIVINPEEARPERKPPEVPPEVHNTTPIDSDRCMAAVRAMCGN